MSGSISRDVTNKVKGAACIIVEQETKQPGPLFALFRLLGVSGSKYSR